MSHYYLSRDGSSRMTMICTEKWQTDVFAFDWAGTDTLMRRNEYCNRRIQNMQLHGVTQRSSLHTEVRQPWQIDHFNCFSTLYRVFWLKVDSPATLSGLNKHHSCSSKVDIISLCLFMSMWLALWNRKFTTFSKDDLFVVNPNVSIVKFQWLNAYTFQIMFINNVIS